jgi:hypothetical protein
MNGPVILLTIASLSVKFAASPNNNFKVYRHHVC